MTTPDDRWKDNSIQFPRLLCEIMAVCEISNDDWLALCESMDLTEWELDELFERAEIVWQQAKADVDAGRR